MPMVVPFIPLIVAAAGATTAGLSMSGVGQPNQEAAARAQQKQLNDMKMQQAQQDAQSKQKSILANMSNAQEQGGGALDSPGLTNLASIIAGLPGEAGTTAGKGALNSYLGTGASATATGQPQENMVSATYGLSGSQG